jgi:hypothetical protein
MSELKKEHHNMNLVYPVPGASPGPGGKVLLEDRSGDLSNVEGFGIQLKKPRLKQAGG